MKNAIVLLAGILILTGCASEAFDEKITDVVRVFMHEPRHYTMWIQKNDSMEVQEITLHRFTVSSVKIFTDVPNDQKIWARYYSKVTNRSGKRGILELHLRSVSDVEGAGFNHGKRGRGQTNVIQ